MSQEFEAPRNDPATRPTAPTVSAEFMENAMSWSRTSQGTPHDVAEALHETIVASVAYEPRSVRRTRTALLVADAARKVITESTDDSIASWNPPRAIIASCSGHINDDGTLGNYSISTTFITPPAVVADEPTPTAPGPDAVTHDEVDAALSQTTMDSTVGVSEKVPEQPQGEPATAEEVHAEPLNNEPATTA
jgi:hypothetical protein